LFSLSQLALIKFSLPNMDLAGEVGVRKHEASPHRSPRVELPHDAPSLPDHVGDATDVIEDHVEDEGSRRAKKRHKVNHGTRTAGLTGKPLTDS